MALDANALISRNAAKAYLGVTDTDRDDAIDDLINQASEWIISTAEQEFAPALNAATRRVEYAGGGVIRVNPFTLRSITAMSFDPAGTPQAYTLSDGYRLRGGKGSRRYQVFDRIVLASAWPAYGAVGGIGSVDITGNWGWPLVPRDIERCTKRLVEMWFRSEIAFSSEEYGDVPALPMGIPLDIRDTVESYRPTHVGAV